jgi:hypothetical protein
MQNRFIHSALICCGRRRRRRRVAQRGDAVAAADREPADAAYAMHKLAIRGAMRAAT